MAYFSNKQFYIYYFIDTFVDRGSWYICFSFILVILGLQYTNVSRLMHKNNTTVIALSEPPYQTLGASERSFVRHSIKFGVSTFQFKAIGLGVLEFLYLQHFSRPLTGATCHKIKFKSSPAIAHQKLFVDNLLFIFVESWQEKKIIFTCLYQPQSSVVSAHVIGVDLISQENWNLC